MSDEPMHAIYTARVTHDGGRVDTFHRVVVSSFSPETARQAVRKSADRQGWQVEDVEVSPVE